MSLTDFSFIICRVAQHPMTLDIVAMLQKRSRATICDPVLNRISVHPRYFEYLPSYSPYIYDQNIMGL
jgi:hypothetical protein